MAAKMGSGSMPAQPDPPAPASTTPAAARAPMKGIDSTVNVGRKESAPPAAAAAKSGSKTLLIAGAVLALLLVAGGVGWLRHRSAVEAEEQQAQQKAASEQAAKSTPTPGPVKPGSTTPAKTSAAKPAKPPATTPAKPVAQPAKPGTTTPASGPTVTLKLTSQPAGAAIFLDGKDSGKVTPAQLTASTGAHKILLRKDGFKDAAMTTPSLAAGQRFDFAPLLQAGKGEENPFKKLFGSGIPEGKGMANFKTSPKGAQVVMNGYSAPKPTPCKLPLDPGTYVVTFQLAGYKPAKKSVTIEKGKTAEVDVSLEKQ
jgi:PEGA domain-containing protein